jgi:hypothetical protein
VQSVVPHLQSTPGVLEIVPFVMAQVLGRNEHVLEVATQNMPVDDVQSAYPHRQSTPALFVVNPVVIAHRVDGRVGQLP